MSSGVGPTWFTLYKPYLSQASRSYISACLSVSLAGQLFYTCLPYWLGVFDRIISCTCLAAFFFTYYLLICGFSFCLVCAQNASALSSPCQNGEFKRVNNSVEWVNWKSLTHICTVDIIRHKVFVIQPIWHGHNNWFAAEAVFAVVVIAPLLRWGGGGGGGDLGTRLWSNRSLFLWKCCPLIFEIITIHTHTFILGYDAKEFSTALGHHWDTWCSNLKAQLTGIAAPARCLVYNRSVLGLLMCQACTSTRLALMSLIWSYGHELEFRFY